MLSDERKAAWDESDSRGFLDHGRFFVPDREEQLATVRDVVPAPEGPAHLVEICCGEGLLAGALLERFPACRVHGYDGSPAMLEQAARALAGHGGRFEPHPFDLFDRSWRAFPWPVHAFVSSLAIHHLDGDAKRELYADLHRALAPGGALVIADLVRPASPEAHALAAAAWDEAVRRRSLELAGDLTPLEVFRRARWNFGRGGTKTCRARQEQDIPRISDMGFLGAERADSPLPGVREGGGRGAGGEGSCFRDEVSS